MLRIGIIPGYSSLDTIVIYYYGIVTNTIHGQFPCFLNDIPLETCIYLGDWPLLCLITIGMIGLGYIIAQYHVAIIINMFIITDTTKCI